MTKAKAFHVEICGGIATGKTTLARRLKVVCDLDAYEEDFAAVPFWKEAYESSGKNYVFQKNVGFQLFHAYCIARIATLGRPAVCDFALFQDLAYADLSPPDEVAVLDAVFERVTSVLPRPRVVLDLSCTTREQLIRIKERARAPEGTIDAPFLERLRHTIDRRRRQFERDYGMRVIDIDTCRVDIRSNDDAVRDIWARVLDAVAARRPSR